MAFLITPMLHNVVPFDVANGFVATFGILGGSEIESATFTITSQTSATALVTKNVSFLDTVTSEIREFSYEFTPSDLSVLSNGTKYVMRVMTENTTLSLISKKSNMVLLQCYDEPVFECTTDIFGTLISKPTITLSLVYSQAQDQELNYYYATLYGVGADSSEELLAETDKEYNSANIILQRYPMPNSSDISPYVSYKIILLGQMKGGKELTYQITGLSMRTYGINLEQSKFGATNLCDVGKIQLDCEGVVAGDYLTGQVITIPNTYDGLLGGSLEIQGETLGGKGTPDVPIPIINVESPIELKDAEEYSPPYNVTSYSVPIKDIDDNIYTLDRLSSTIYDRIYYNMADGKWYVEKKCKDWFFDGTGITWGFQSKNVYNIANFQITGLSNVGSVGLCDRFPLQTSLIANTTTDGFLINTTTIFIRIDVSRLTGWSDSWTSAQKVAAFNTWLASNNTTLIQRPSALSTYELHADTVAILENLLSKNGSTYLFSTNTTMPYYNYLNFDGILTGQYLIKRRKPTETVWITLQSYTITTLSDLLFTMYDTYNASDTDYQYALVPINVDGTEGTYMAFNIASEFNGAYLCDYEKSYSIYNELKFDSFERVQNSGIIESFGARYPTIQNNATINYNKGTFTFNIMATNYTSASDVDRQAEIDLREEIADFITNGRMKIMKDYNGNIWLVATYNGVTYTFIKELGNGVANATFNWAEKGDANSEEDLEKMGMLNQFEIITA